MEDCDEFGVLEALERPMPAVNIERLQEAAADPSAKLIVVFELGYRLKTNDVVFKLVVYEVPNAKRWLQQCQSNVFNLITNRPLTTHEICGGMCCWTKWMRISATRNRLVTGMDSMCNNMLLRTQVTECFLECDSIHIRNVVMYICICRRS